MGRASNQTSNTALQQLFAQVRAGRRPKTLTDIEQERHEEEIATFPYKAIHAQVQHYGYLRFAGQYTHAVLDDYDYRPETEELIEAVASYAVKEIEDVIRLYAESAEKVLGVTLPSSFTDKRLYNQVAAISRQVLTAHATVPDVLEEKQLLEAAEHALLVEIGVQLYHLGIRPYFDRGEIPPVIQSASETEIYHFKTNLSQYDWGYSLRDWMLEGAPPAALIEDLRRNYYLTMDGYKS